MSSNQTTKSWGALAITALLCMILWVLTELLSEYKKNNMPEQEKTELLHKERAEAIEYERLAAASFDEIKTQEAPIWLMLRIYNSLVFRVVIALIVIIGI